MTGIDAAIAARRTAKASKRARAKQTLERGWAKARRRQPAAENVLRQLIERRSFREPFRSTLWADVVANVVRNVWSHGIIFCGHFPDQTYTFSQDEVEDESKGARYVRQLIGAANIEGGPLFHIISGNLGYQVEHHLYPDMPSTRYGEIAPRVREICQRYDLPYNTGPLWKQWGMVQRTIIRLAFPGGKPRPKPGPYRGDKVINPGEREERMAAA
jgi:linoleoyl-CoA desaturase